MPAMCPTRGELCEAQAADACAAGAMNAAVLVASMVAVPSAAIVRVARRPLRLSALLITCPPPCAGARTVGGSPNVVPGWTYVVARRLVVSRTLVDPIIRL